MNKKLSDKYVDWWIWQAQNKKKAKKRKKKPKSDRAFIRKVDRELNERLDFLLKE